MNSMQEEERDRKMADDDQQSSSMKLANWKTATDDIIRLPSTTGGLYNSSNSDNQGGNKA